ncbi:MarR family winged helix-turn-helix transcriptional regulator [Microcella humidisoli]|uniref:MarR family transcriptional regulator n=1 Tax=Microcella humidisoli TaxID=2963406 RepID=A0ABY5FVK5_9MICO|nr:MarR family transcriptional regulator [Microcella humidisoli]UTT61806.1 MarR family transcriptional regulator [Microcella humidisoli]
MSQSDQQTPSFGESHAATLLLREFLDVTSDFERSLGDELAVNPTDLTAMQHLIAAGPLSPTALAERLELSSGAVTTVIDRLESLGHVHRTPNPDDRRGTIIVPTPASVGRAMGRIIPMVTEVDSAIHDFDEQERAVITRYLQRVVDAYRDHAGPAERPRGWRADATPR